MYLGRFLGVTLDTYQDTSGYVYLGLFITIHLMIHEDTPRYKIKIHVSWTLPWCHTGYISGYIRIRVSWTLHHDTSYDTSGYTEIQNHDTKMRPQTTYVRRRSGAHHGARLRHLLT
jgi:hypothetical protein